MFRQTLIVAVFVAVILFAIPANSGQLNRLYNEKVVRVERMQRPMSSSGKGLPVPHQGAR